MRTLHVHIGTHKTGTTSIQVFLRQNAEAFRRCGVYVPTTGTLDPISGHHNIAWELRGDRRFDPAHGTLDDLMAEISGSDAPAAVISAEDFEYLSRHPDAIARLQDAAQKNGFAPRYIVFFREHASYSRALHKTLLDYELTESYSVFAAKILARKHYAMHDGWWFDFDYARFVREWPGRPLRVVAYDDDLLPNFVRAIGADAMIGQVKDAPRYHATPDRRPTPRWLELLFRLRFHSIQQVASLQVRR